MHDEVFSSIITKMLNIKYEISYLFFILTFVEVCQFVASKME